MFTAEKERLILTILAEAGSWMFGLDIIKASGGKLKRGVIYVYLTRLKEHGYITSKKVEVTIPSVLQINVNDDGNLEVKKYQTSRRCYHITKAGEDKLREYEKEDIPTLLKPILSPSF
jgi:DNA-binding PadR family transcriptional regulator